MHRQELLFRVVAVLRCSDSKKKNERLPPRTTSLGKGDRQNGFKLADLGCFGVVSVAQRKWARERSEELCADKPLFFSRSPRSAQAQEGAKKQARLNPVLEGESCVWWDNFGHAF